MTACEDNESTGEELYNSITHGVFTGTLLKYFKDNRPNEVPSRYCDIREQIEKQMSPQTPQVFGRDRLLFFGDIEPSYLMPLYTRIEESTSGTKLAVLSIGKVHGVREGAEFTTYSLAKDLVFSISTVSEFECKAVLSPEESQILKAAKSTVIQSRWYYDSDILQIIVGSSLGADFRTELHKYLRKRIANQLQIIQAEQETDEPHEGAPLRLARNENGNIGIFGPESLIGYNGPIRDLDIQGKDNDELAMKSAVLISHLTRFRQILNLREHSSQEPAPFRISLKEVAGAEIADSFLEGTNFNFTFHNESKSGLYLTVICLGPAFSVRQLYPSYDSGQKVQASSSISFKFRFEVPGQLKRIQEGAERRTHRDIIRTIVTRDKSISWKRQELPDIWVAGPVKEKPDGPERNAKLVSESSWWTNDIEVSTHCAE